MSMGGPSKSRTWVMKNPANSPLCMDVATVAIRGPGRGEATVTPLLKGKVLIPPPAELFLDPHLSKEIFLWTPLCHEKFFSHSASRSHKKCASKMQNYTYFEEDSKTHSKSAFLGIFLQFRGILPPSWSKKFFPPPEAKSSSPHLEQKSESPPLPAHLLPHSCRPPPCPSMTVVHSSEGSSLILHTTELETATQSSFELGTALGGKFQTLASQGREIF